MNCGHMRKISEKELKEIMLEGLVEFRNQCQKYNLRYYLAYGSLLGAVRHRGFIPWDDDIDIWMPREDYDKMISISEEFSTTSWEVVNNQINNKYLFTFAKFCNKHTVTPPSRFRNGFLYGVCIDLFPLESSVESQTEFEVKCMMDAISRKYGVMLGRYYGFSNTSSFVEKSKQMMCRLYARIKYPTYSEIIKMLDAEYRKQGTAKGNFVYCCQTHLRNIWKVDDFGSGVELLFEKHYFVAPNNYDVVLKSLYGDYFQLPDESDRKAPHEFYAYWK